MVGCGRRFTAAGEPLHQRQAHAEGEASLARPGEQRAAGGMRLVALVVRFVVRLHAAIIAHGGGCNRRDWWDVMRRGVPRRHDTQ